MLTDKEKYMLDYYNNNKDNEKVEISLDLNTELLDIIDTICKEKDISINDFITLALTEKLIEIEKEKHIDSFENIADIFDMYDIESYLDSGKTYLLIEPTGKNIVLVPIKEYEELIKNIDD